MSMNETVMHESRVFAPSTAMIAQANVSGMAAYDALCREAADDYAGFWARLARETLDWHRPFTRTLDETEAPFYKWFEDGQLNASHNCLDRNLANGNADKTAIIFEADDGANTSLTYRQLHARVCRFANALRGMGVTKGDRVIITMRAALRAPPRALRAL